MENSFRLNLTLAGIAAVLAIGALAYWDGMFLVSQFVKKFPRGFPLVAKGDWWSSLILIPMVLYLFGGYIDKPSLDKKLVALLIGLAVSAALCEMYRHGKFPDALVGAGRISPAGILFLPYFAAIIAAGILFYVYCAPTRTHVIGVGIVLAVHFVVANHVPLNALNNHYHYVWCPQIFVDETRPLLILGAVCGGIGLVTWLKYRWPGAWL